MLVLVFWCSDIAIDIDIFSCSYFFLPLSLCHCVPVPVPVSLSLSLSLLLFVIRSIGGYKNGISQLCEEVSCDDISIKLYSTEKSVISGGEDNYLYAEKYAVVNGGADNGHHGSSINIHGFPPESQGGLVITGGEDNIDMTDNALPAPQVRM